MNEKKNLTTEETFTLAFQNHKKINNNWKLRHAVNKDGTDD